MTKARIQYCQRMAKKFAVGKKGTKRYEKSFAESFASCKRMFEYRGLGRRGSRRAGRRS